MVCAPVVAGAVTERVALPSAPVAAAASVHVPPASTLNWRVLPEMAALSEVLVRVPVSVIVSEA
jgi:hypothetical protein